MTAYDKANAELAAAPRTWLITGVAGFIGSHLLEALLKLDQRVIGLDNFSTGYKHNLEEVCAQVGEQRWQRFQFIEGDMREPEVCQHACANVEFVLHHAALGSVPRSLGDPSGYHHNNVSGFLNMLLAAKAAAVERFIFASSSAVYGDDPGLPKVEAKVGKPLSPYAATKMMNEAYAAVFARAYGFSSIGLRYFNVFGPRQDPDGAYAAVIPKWTAALLHGEPVYINGDGQTSRDFCYVENVVQANLLAATAPNRDALNEIYNIAVGERTTLNELFYLLRTMLVKEEAGIAPQKPAYREFRAADVRHSLADITKAQRLLHYKPAHNVREGLARTMTWYERQAMRQEA